MSDAPLEPIEALERVIEEVGPLRAVLVARACHLATRNAGGPPSAAAVVALCGNRVRPVDENLVRVVAAVVGVPLAD
jgi:hypothetical protein